MGRETRVETHRGQQCLTKNIASCLTISFSGEQSEQVDEGAKNKDLSCLMCEPMEPDQSFGDDTHAVIHV